jgi:hypothetical protein
VENDTHPEDVSPVEMTTPAPRKKVWLDSNVNRKTLSRTVTSTPPRLNRVLVP